MFLTPIQLVCVWQKPSSMGTGRGDCKSARLENGGCIAAFDSTLAQRVQNACEAIPPLPRKPLRDKINVSHIVLIVANKCLNDLM